MRGFFANRRLSPRGPGAALLIGFFVMGCSSHETQTRGTTTTTTPGVQGSASAVPGNHYFVAEPERSLPKREKKPLPDGMLRAPVFVLPEDASVEVGGHPTYRRNGAIDIVARPGEEVRVRVFKGTDERTKTITLRKTANGAVVLPSPTVDLYELAQARKRFVVIQLPDKLP